jgi:hypothetical protein
MNTENFNKETRKPGRDFGNSRRGKFSWLPGLIINCLLLSVLPAHAYPPGPASQAQVNAGTEPYLYVTPKTLANSTITVASATTAGTANSLTNFGLSHMLYVDKNGNNSSAVRGDFTHSWVTSAALFVATNGDCVRFGKGSFSLPSTVLSNGVSVKGLGVNLSVLTGVLEVNSSNQIEGLTFSDYIHSTNAFNGLTLEGVQVGTLSTIDCILSSVIGGGTNVTVNNSTFFSYWDIGAGIGGGTWNNDQIIMSDAAAPNYSAGMHAYYISGDNSTLIINGGIVNMTATVASNYFILGTNHNDGFIVYNYTQTPPTNASVRIYGTVFNHSAAAGSRPINAIVNPNRQTNIFGWYWDNSVLTFVNGTNIYQPYNLGTFTGSLIYPILTTGPAGITNGLSATWNSNGVATWLRYSAVGATTNTDKQLAP